MDNFNTLQNFSSLDNFVLENFGGEGSPTTPPAQPQDAYSAPDYGITSANILILYDSSSADSIEVKDYLLANRPRFTGAHTLGCNLSGLLSGTDGFESISHADFATAIAAPLLAYITTNPDVFIYACSYGFPTRISDYSSHIDDGSIHYRLTRIGAATTGDNEDAYDEETGIGQGDITHERFRVYEKIDLEEYPRTRALVSSYSFETKAATLRYIDFIKDTYNLLDTNNQGLLISGQAAGLKGSYYLIDNNHKDTYNGSSGDTAVLSKRNHLAAQHPEVNITYKADNTELILSGESVSAFMTWGHHSSDTPNELTSGHYESNGAITFTNSRWWWFRPIESFSGRRSTGRLSCFESTGFGSVNYENCPIFFCAFVEEPGVGGAIALNSDFPYWESGTTILEAVWRARSSKNATFFGDPLLTIADPVPSASLEPYSLRIDETFDTVFGALQNEFDEIEGLQVGLTGFIKENTKLPYASISKTGDFFLQRYSCGSQLERSIYTFTVFTETQEELLSIFDELEDQFTN
jgi:hypothetical protein